jgi:redox-sensitive bicupin YhaK (pirin superfamily)
MGHGALRVWNDDEIAPNTGFPAHPHANMEIITYVREGAITHQDSLGNKGRTEAGDVQVMSAGSGITHAEQNLEDGPTTLFQIWIVPDHAGAAPSWGQREFPRGERAGKFEILASGTPEHDDALPIRVDAKVAAATLSAGTSTTWASPSERHQYLVAPVTRREGLVEGERIEGGKTRPLGPGDVLLLPAGVPHWFGITAERLVLLGTKLPVAR